MIPADIDKKEFKTTRVKEGYDQDEVDDFLDRVAAQWVEDHATMARQEVEITRLRRQLAEAQAIADAYDVTQAIPAPSPAESATRILEFAQRTADDVMAQAKKDADILRAQTENDLDELMKTTRAQSDAMMNEARGTVYQLEQEVKVLQGKKKETQDYLRGYLRRALNDLEESGG